MKNFEWGQVWPELDEFADLAITIRTAVIKDGKASVQAGAGVVAESNPAYEVRGNPEQGGRRAQGNPDCVPASGTWFFAHAVTVGKVA